MDSLQDSLKSRLLQYLYVNYGVRKKMEIYRDVSRCGRMKRILEEFDRDCVISQERGRYGGRAIYVELTMRGFLVARWVYGLESLARGAECNDTEDCWFWFIYGTGPGDPPGEV